MTKSDANLMDPTKRLNDAPKCTATAQSTGKRCKAPAVRGWRVCRILGAGGGHASGPDHLSWRHGQRSREAEELRKTINEFIRTDKTLQKLIH
ncbi:hypothetical protein NBRC116589_17950 [Ruegeria sp. HU-ET01832]|uniref:hypothetical protein n=1 Tax=Ruegeria sp. HU-ET01832 TaxID=3135906 RepID=UPI00310594EE